MYSNICKFYIFLVHVLLSHSAVYIEMPNAMPKQMRTTLYNFPHFYSGKQDAAVIPRSIEN